MTIIKLKNWGTGRKVAAIILKLILVLLSSPSWAGRCSPSLPSLVKEERGVREGECYWDVLRALPSFGCGALWLVLPFSCSSVLWRVPSSLVFGGRRWGEAAGRCCVPFLSIGWCCFTTGKEQAGPPLYTTCPYLTLPLTLPCLTFTNAQFTFHISLSLSLTSTPSTCHVPLFYFPVSTFYFLFFTLCVFFFF